MRGERPQELELDIGQLNCSAVDLDAAAPDVDHQAVRADHVLLAVEAGDRGPAQERADATAELSDRERFRDVVVRAQLEPHHLVELVVPGGEHDDRHLALGA